jgi:site-specific DNA-methyltransferase (adenine-specific)
MKKNIIYNEDCLIGIKNIKDKSIDLICTDIPYFGVVKDEWDNQWKNLEEYLNWFENLVKEYKRVIKDTGSIFIFTGRQYNRHLSIILDKYFIEQRIIIWKRKRNMSQTRGKAMNSSYEPLCYYTAKEIGYTYNNLKVPPEKHLQKRKEYTTGHLKDGVAISDVWDIPALPHNAKENTKHPTQKPLKIIEQIIKMASKEGDIVLDTFMGSGTTAEAAIKLNRYYIGFELTNKYIEIIDNRIK